MKRALPQYAVYVAQVPGSSADKNYTSTHAALSVGSHAKTRYYSTLQETREETNGDDDTATTRPRWSVAIDPESLMVVLSAPVRPVLEYAHSKAARSEATTRSQDMASPKPPAAAMPSTDAMNGFGARRISEMVLWMYSRICLKTAP